jgi:hypothetical protein
VEDGALKAPFWWKFTHLAQDEYRVGGPLIARSNMIDLGPAKLADLIDWP